MNSLMMNARICGDPQTSDTKEGTLRTCLTVEEFSSELPLRFTILLYGNKARDAARLGHGDEVMLTGRMTANAMSKSIAVIANNIELLFENVEEKHNGNASETKK